MDVQAVLAENKELLATLIQVNQQQKDAYQETLQAFADALGYQKNGRSWQKDLAAGHTGTLLHGPGGMFSTLGLDSTVISLHVRARGLGSLIPAYPSNTKYDRFGFLTGISGDIGDEPVNPCDDAPTGYMKSGTLTAKWGHLSRDTNTIRTPDTIWQLNSGETMDLQLLGRILDPEFRGLGYPSDLDESGVLDMVTKAEMVIAGMNMERKLNKLLWSGDGSGANDTAGKGYVEFAGLDSLIATGQVDSELNIAMPGADSTIIDLNYGLVGSTDIVAPFEEVEDYIFNLAIDTGVDPVKWVIVMRPQAWRAISSIWPIQYNTQPEYTAIAGGDYRLLLDARANIDARDQMRAGMYLDLNGRRYDVVLDTGIVEDNSGTDANLDIGEFASAIYFVPLTINGNFPVLYWNHLDHRLSVSAAAPFLGHVENFWTDSGRFLWSTDHKYTCFRLKMEVDPRIVLRTPHLAAKIQRVKYARTWTTLRDPDPASSYWVNGGVSHAIRNLTLPQYAPWLS